MRSTPLPGASATRDLSAPLSVRLQLIPELAEDGRVKKLEVRKVNGDPPTGDAVPDGLLDHLRAAGFVDGYRGLVHR